MNHPVVGQIPAPPNPIHVDGEDDRSRRAGPRLGEHTAEVLREILGLDRDEIDRLAGDGVLL
jgi:crotonobetainyl-CoA:carnitine CoA-transferase CaiB-like acyl-CoA transferase